MTAPVTIAVTSGEPAGIGPDLCARLAERRWAVRLVLFGDIELLRDRARRLGAGVRLVPYARGDSAPGGAIEVAHYPLAARVTAGRPEIANARAVLAMLDAALAGCASGEFAAMVTAPVQKSVINAAGIPFTGHTEYLAARTGTPHVVMLLVGRAEAAWLRVALATTHLPLAAVPAAITRDGLVATLQVIVVGSARQVRHRSAAHRRVRPQPARRRGRLSRARGNRRSSNPPSRCCAPPAPTSPDRCPPTRVFVPQTARGFDCIVAMYHDQGLPALKQASFGHGVNVTLGLPIVRTSVDHGTALDLAADPARARSADPGSLVAATELAIDLARRAVLTPNASR